jgi:hypothetical protein
MRISRYKRCAASSLALAGVFTLRAQDFTQRGYLETRLQAYPQAARGDSSHAVADALFRYEAAYKPNSFWRFAGVFDAQTDTHRQVERRWNLSWQDRTIPAPAFSVRRLSAAYSRAGFTVEAGKQSIRWGKADLLNPTDRFAPRDYLRVVDNDFLAVTAGRLIYERGANTIDLVYVPRFTPSRIPLLGQRWVVFPESIPAEVQILDLGSRFPGGPQFGARWNHVGSGFEYSACFYQGFQHLPLLEARAVSLRPPRVEFQRLYPNLRLYGGDVAIPLTWFVVKAEAAWFTTSSTQADEYVQYVIQLERTRGEWFFVGGYAGEAVTNRRSPFDFAPDRGFARAFLFHAGYNLDTNRSLAFESSVRQNGDGLWMRWQYSHALGQHWRATAGFNWIRGDAADFLGQYRRNSHASLALRYSF